MINLLAWIIIGGSIGWVASLVIRKDAQQHAAQYHVFRPNRPRVPVMSSTYRSETTVASGLYPQVVGMGRGESSFRRDSPLSSSR